MPAKKQASESNDAASTTSNASRQKTRRESVVDRRSGIDRRDLTGGSFETNLERRRGPGRRRSDFLKAAEEGEMTQEQFLFIKAIDAFKRANSKTFPTWTDVLEVVRKLGYRKTMPSELNLGQQAEDWIERADAPSNVSKVSESPEESGEDGGADSRD